MLRPVEYGVLCLPSLSVNGTQLDRVVLINEECYKTWSWNLCGVELRTKGGRTYDIDKARVNSCGNQAVPCENAENNSEESFGSEAGEYLIFFHSSHAFSFAFSCALLQGI